MSAIIETKLSSDPTRRNWSDLNFATVTFALVAGPLIPFGLFALPALLVTGWIFPFLLVIAFVLAIWSLVSGYAYILFVTRLRGGIGRRESVLLGMATACSMLFVISAAAWISNTDSGSSTAFDSGETSSAVFLLFGILCLPLGALGGWIFWRIGVRPKASADLARVFD